MVKMCYCQQMYLSVSPEYSLNITGPFTSVFCHLLLTLPIIQLTLSHFLVN